MLELSWPMSSRFSRRALAACSCALLALACSPEAAPPAADPQASAADAPLADVAASEVDAPPEDLKSSEKVRCLVDSPPGCDGCDKGDACVYEELTRYDCVYVVYGTDCSK